MHRRNSCDCWNCEKARINQRNKVRIKRYRIDEIEPIPPKPEGFHMCPCKRCVNSRRSRRDRIRSPLDNYKIIIEGRAVDPNFKPHGPGRYDWDRTTEKDYNHEAGRPIE